MNTPFAIDHKEQRLLVTLSDAQREQVRKLQGVIKEAFGLDLSHASVIRGAIDAYRYYLLEQLKEGQENQNWDAVFCTHERKRLIAVNGINEKRIK